MKILVTGITGSIGGQLAPHLLAAAEEVRALSRRADADVPAGVELMTGDALTGDGLSAALSGVEVAYYLIHSMEPAAGSDFGASEQTSIANFTAAAAAAGVRRVVYLGGLVPSGTGQPSAHLASRLAVEETLLSAGRRGEIEAVALRASIVIAASSRSFRFLVRLVERLPVVVLPTWREHRTAPVDGRDVISALAKAATAASAAGASLDLAGPDVVSYGDLIMRLRDQLLLRRPAIHLPGPALTPIASRVAAVLAGEQHALIGPLMEGLSGDLLPREPLATEVLGIRPHSLDSALAHALREWESQEQLRAR